MSSIEPAIKSAFGPRWGVLLAGSLIVLAALAAYHNSFSGPFILDDSLAITTNQSIKRLTRSFSLHASSTTSGRPLLNLTFALNYTLGGMNVWGYHAVNLLVHILAGLTLFGITRRTLLFDCGRGGLTPQLGRSRGEATPPTTLAVAARRSEISDLKSEIIADATPLALAIAIIWVVHPTQTEAVTYISQRAESLMGLFYLLTLYCFVRYTDKTGERRSSFAPFDRLRAGNLRTTEDTEARDRKSELTKQRLASALWPLASGLCCLLGMATKEVMVSAPLMVLLYDRTFVAGSFCKAWRQRWRYYLGLACTWLLLGRLMRGLAQRSVGFDEGVTWWHYALTSCRSLVLYLRMAVWPHPLIFDYGTHITQHANEALPYALVLAAVLAAILIALRYRPVIGFVGAWFFVILAPTSSVVPVAFQPMAEHRIYLSLAAVVVLVVVGLYRLIGRRSLLVCVILAAELGWLTVQRNQDYKTELSIWTDTVAKCPGAERPHGILGNLLLDLPGRLPDAITQYEAALRINPDSAEMHVILGNAFFRMPDHLSDAIAQNEAALRLKPDYAEAHSNLGTAFLRLPGRLPDAIAEYEAALRIKPDDAKTHFNLGNALRGVPGRLPDAIAQYEAALRIEPNSVQAHVNLGTALLKMPERLPNAIAQFQAALRIDPDLAEAHNDLGNALFNLPGRLPDAIAEYEAALKLNPNSVTAHYNLANALLKMPGRTPDAIAQFQAALRLKPDLKPARELLDQLQKENERTEPRMDPPSP